MFSLSPLFPDSNAYMDQKYQGIASDAARGEMCSSAEQTGAVCLPARTTVLITGNNRTKKSLVGQQAIVKRAVGLGGWHHCVLQDGSEVKLQRNALSVLEMGPPESLDDISGSSSDTEAREPKIEILTQPRVRRPPKSSFHASDMPLFKKAEATNNSGMRTTYSLVDLHKLDTPSLKRYRRVFHLPEVDAATPKAELVTAVQRHFTTQIVDEDEVLLELVCALRRRHKKQQLLLSHQHQQQHPPVMGYSSLYDSSNCSSQQQLQQQQLQQQQLQESAEEDEEQEDEYKQLFLLQQQCAYSGPCLFQEQQQQPQPPQQQ